MTHSGVSLFKSLLMELGKVTFSDYCLLAAMLVAIIQKSIFFPQNVAVRISVLGFIPGLYQGTRILFKPECRGSVQMMNEPTRICVNC